MISSNLYTLDELHQIVSQLSVMTIGDNESLYSRVELNKVLLNVFEIRAVRARDASIVDTTVYHLVPDKETPDNARVLRNVTPLWWSIIPAEHALPGYEITEAVKEINDEQC